MTEKNKNISNSSWIDIKNASRFTGLSKSTIRRAIQKGQLKCSKSTGKLLFKRIAINDWLGG